MRLKIIDLRSCSGIPEDQKRQKVVLVLTCFLIQTFLGLPASFFPQITIDSFLLEADYLFLNLEEFVLYIRIRIVIGKMLLVLRNLDFPTCPSQKLHI